jgi:hypothetical protein
MHPPSGRELAPLGQGSGAVLLEDVAAVEMAVLVEVVVKCPSSYKLEQLAA